MDAKTYQDQNQAYCVLPFITIVVFSDESPVLFKIGKLKRYCDYKAFCDAIRFFYGIIGKGKENGKA